MKSFESTRSLSPRARIAAAKRDLRDRRFLDACKSAGLPAPRTEYVFHPTRQWRWDFAWPSHRVALEVDGGVWVKGAHGRGSGIIRDHEKRNAATALGWRYLVVVPKELASAATVALIKQTLRAVA